MSEEVVEHCSVPDDITPEIINVQESDWHSLPDLPEERIEIKISEDRIEEIVVERFMEFCSVANVAPVLMDVHEPAPLPDDCVEYLLHVIKEVST
jgi:hypothetical protein